MEIINGVEAKSFGLYLKKEKVAVISDLHIGFEEALNKQGILVPRFQFEDLTNELKKFLKDFETKIVVVNGDLKHEFGTISETEWRQTLQIIDLLMGYCEKIVLIKGNHDTIIGPIANKRNVEVKDYFVAGEFFICHGDKILKNKEFDKAKNVIIGHEHPAVSFREGGRSETYKCFLKGKFKNKNLIVLPSMNFVTEGTNILREQPLSPFLKNIDDFEVYAISEDEILDFGKIKNLKTLS
ncbi:metallophosphoesterase [Candidatus Woesearchaeota archaeon]|nr:metallophosphoesterase [Candidatus Woesearchaeota archaeon]